MKIDLNTKAANSDDNKYINKNKNINKKYINKNKNI